MPYRRNHLRAFIGFVTLAGLSLGSLAFAANDKMYAPQICVPVEGTDNVSGQATIRIDAVEQIMGSEYQTFVCPLVRDVLASNLAALRVWVGNAHPKDHMPPECCVYSLSPTTNYYDYACAAADDTEGRQALVFDLADFEEALGGFYVVTCDLGFGDTIHGIRTREL